MIKLVTQSQPEINLREALSQQLRSDISTQLDLTIEVPAHQTITINDNLVSYQTFDHTTTHNITFVIHEHAQLVYTMQVVPTHEQPLEQNSLALSSTAPVFEKNLTINLAGEHAQAQLKCAVLGSTDQSFKFKTLQHHQAAHTTSNLEVKAVLDGKARLVCNSMIKVEKAAQHTDAHLENKNILMSKGARAVSIPQLEIEANEVKCGHGAAVSKLSNDDLFYLQSRGIDEQTTKRLLIDAFLRA